MVERRDYKKDPMAFFLDFFDVRLSPAQYRTANDLYSEMYKNSEIKIGLDPASPMGDNAFLIVMADGQVIRQYDEWRQLPVTCACGN